VLAAARCELPDELYFFIQTPHFIIWKAVSGQVASGAAFQLQNPEPYNSGAFSTPDRMVNWLL
jgi:hypothetical protein